MKSIFDRNGKTIAWLKESEIFNLGGTNIGFLDKEAVHNLRANYKGTFTNGFFRDKRGNSVAFVDGASNGPIPPIPNIPPIPPIPSIPPIHPIPPIPPIAPIPSFSWSNIDWNEFIS
ncbi:4-fold beta flower protein [Ekhidna sp.]